MTFNSPVHRGTASVPSRSIATTPSRSRLGLLNAYQGGVCRTIKAQYFKSSVANFLLQTTRGATGVLIEYEF